MNYAVEQRLRFIDFMLSEIGYVNRKHIAVFFGTSKSMATVDMNLYRTLASDNCDYNLSARRWEKSAEFFALYNHDRIEE